MAIIIGLTAVCGYHLSGNDLSVSYMLILFLSQALVAAAGFAYNDILDRGRDAGLSFKPLATDHLSLSQACLTAVGLSLTGLCMALQIGIFNGALAAIQIFIVFGYSAIKAKSGVTANLVTAMLCSSGFIYGCIPHNNIGYAWLPAVLAFIVVWAREMVKDVLDMEPDKIAGIPTVPLKYGMAKTKVYVTILTVSAMFISLYPIVYLILGAGYTYIITLANILLVAALLCFWKGHKLHRTTWFLNATAISFALVILACFM